MAAPFKRICCQAVRHTTRCRRRNTPQWQPLRPFSNRAPTQQADHLDSDNPFLTPFPENQSQSENNSTLDPTYEEDDISSLGLSELDQHRELRDLVRTAAWEMPLLASLHKPFEPPVKQQSPLRWRYTTYMGEVHPAQSKVVVEFNPNDIQGLNHAQRDKLRKLAGVRYDHTRNRVKMSCESFETQAQNKRYLGDIIAALISESTDPNADTFEDVPLDTRHVKRKLKFKFPTHWKLTEERKQELDALRRRQLLDEGQKGEEDRLVSGEAAIEAARQVKLKELKEPVMAEARQPLPRGKMGKREMGQQRAQR